MVLSNICARIAVWPHIVAMRRVVDPPSRTDRAFSDPCSGSVGGPHDHRNHQEGRGRSRLRLHHRSGEHGAGYDGLTPLGVNTTQGAESTATDNVIGLVTARLRDVLARVRASSVSDGDSGR